MSHRPKLSAILTRRLAPLPASLFFLCLVLTAGMYPMVREGRGACSPRAEAFEGYSFLLPDIINKNAAYAPFFVKWEDYYERFYFKQDIQRSDNLQEWIDRFCGQPIPAHVEEVVYYASIQDLGALLDRVSDKASKAPVPYPFGGNTFAEMLVEQGCAEVVSYLIFTRKCEPYVVNYGEQWRKFKRDTAAMQMLIREGLGRFESTYSHFVKMRYAYQIVRLAHYAGNWRQTLELFETLMPRIDQRRPSILYYWALGHAAGALQKLGRRAEAAYRYSLIFRYCPSKRTQAFHSFFVKNDTEFEAALKECRHDADRATLYLMRAGKSRTFTVTDMATIYDLDPANPQLDLMLVSDLQELERIFLRSSVTDHKHGISISQKQWKNAAQHLIDLQKLVRRIVKEDQTANPPFWKAMEGYLEVLAGDHYAANATFNKASRRLDRSDPYEAVLLRQIEIWRVLSEILKLDPSDTYADQLAFRIRSYKTFEEFPRFGPFLSDWLSAAYAATNHPGKALITAYPTKALTYNPQIDAIDDLLMAAEEENPVFMEKAMQMDTNPERLRTYLLEIKGAALLSAGQPEAAVSVMQQITSSEQLSMKKFSPFREIWHEKINRPVTDTLLLSRLEIGEKILTYEFRAKAAEALGKPEAARYYYLIGLAYYNMSYFGYEWEVTDFFRSGANWLRLSQGPVFPLADSPAGNKENIGMDKALEYFDKAIRLSQDNELSARALFMAARCRQKQWFASPDCTYKPGSKLIPLIPDGYNAYYKRLKSDFGETDFYKEMIQECKWLNAY